MNNVFIVVTAMFLVSCTAQNTQTTHDIIDASGFDDSAHHWYDINDEEKVIIPRADRPRYSEADVALIAENILLYQRSNGGWPKNYDMRAILTNEQRQLLLTAKNDISQTTFDNGATHSQIEYLAKAQLIVNDSRYRDACLRGIDFILAAQYSNGGFPQFFPDTSGYRKHITFNDGAMVGVMKVLRNIVQNKPQYSFVDAVRREKVNIAFERGIDCILRCQITVNGILTAWCQQHDHNDFRPQNARSFEPASICSQESAEIVELLMSIKHPAQNVIDAISYAVQWFERSKIYGIRIENVKIEVSKFKYHTAVFDKVVIMDSTAPPVWARMYEIDTNRPLFCRRDGKIVYSLAEVELERRTGYQWYNYEPESVLKRYAKWGVKHNAVSDSVKIMKIN